MSGINTSEKRDELHELTGALAILTALREEMEQWLEEAQDASKQETLENVVGHLAAMEAEYRRRRRMIGGE
jgi:flagellar motility protein MotE (MotC chaperone)